MTVFLALNGSPHATVTVEGRRETWPVRSQAFRGWLIRAYHEAEKRVPREQAIRDAVNVLAGEALVSGKVEDVHVRFASHDGKLYLDLADTERQVVEISSSGWRIVTDPPVRFRRPRGMMALPVPINGGGLGPLVRLLNLPDEGDSLVLVKGWFASTLQPDGALPLLVFGGEQGSAKSTAALLLKMTVDPSLAPLRSEPRDVGDLMIAATNNRVIALDNISDISPWLSDALCRLATGGGLSKRELYSDADETILEARRPVILTGIEDLASRPDLLDRCVLVNLSPIGENKRRTEQEVLREFRAAHPHILGGLLDAAVVGLRERGRVALHSLPRMADFARWVAGCSTALDFEAHEFISAYGENRNSANSVALDASPVAAAVFKVLEKGTFEGVAQDLLQRMVSEQTPETIRHHSWPKTPRALRGALNRLAGNFRAIGVNVTFLPRTGRLRPILIERVAGDCAGSGDGSQAVPSRRPSSHNSLKTHGLHGPDDGGDGCDGSDPPSSARGPGNQNGADDGHGHANSFAEPTPADVAALEAHLRDGWVSGRPS